MLHTPRKKETRSKYTIIPTHEGAQCFLLEKPIQHATPVAHFFPFVSKNSYQFEIKERITKAIQKALPHGVTVTWYHMILHGHEFEYVLSEAWAVAVSNSVEQLVFQPWLYGVRKAKTITDRSHVKDVFLSHANIIHHDYDAAYNFPRLRNFMREQRRAARDFEPYFTRGFGRSIMLRKRT